MESRGRSSRGTPLLRHPEHERLTRAVPGFYTRSRPEMGYVCELGRFGFYSSHPRISGTGRLTVRDACAGDVAALLAEVRQRYGEEEARLWIDDRGTDAELGPALVEAGLIPDSPEVFLAHVGEAPSAAVVGGLAVESVDDDPREFAVTKLKAFDSCERDPDEEQVAREISIRRAEAEGEGRFLLARLKGEPAAILGFYEGEDRFIFQLATRTPFRGLGIARSLLCDSIADAYGEGRRSVLINADEEDWPVRFYRALGFTDEVYWRRRYRLLAGEHPAQGA